MAGKYEFVVKKDLDEYFYPPPPSPEEAERFVQDHRGWVAFGWGLRINPHPPIRLVYGLFVVVVGEVGVRDDLRFLVVTYPSTRRFLNQLLLHCVRVWYNPHLMHRIPLI